MRPDLFFIGDIGIPSYWALLMIGFMAAIYFSWREARHDRLDPNRILDLDLIVLFVGVLGARLMHVLAEDDPLHPGRPIFYYYLEHPGDIFRMWNGLAFFGGLLLALPVGLWFAKRKKLGVGKIADIAAVSICLGLVFGRLGCFFAGCCFGKPTSLPWGVRFDHADTLARPLDVPLHPTQLYEAIFALLLFVLLWIQKRKWRRFEGQVMLSFLCLYSAGRFLLEFLRNDNRGLFFDNLLSSSQLVGLVVILATIPLLILLKKPADNQANEGRN
jgi:phosphatidylglycerol---prolipoprotein diacylglyceryl transferase